MPRPRSPKPRHSPSPNPYPQISSPEFEQSLSQLEQKLQALKAEYQQICQDQARWQTLQAEAEALVEQHPLDPELAVHLAKIQQEITHLETLFHSRFFSWEGFGTVFWQGVRFLGLGLVLGWVLRSSVG